MQRCNGLPYGWTDFGWSDFPPVPTPATSVSGTTILTKRERLERIATDVLVSLCMNSKETMDRSRSEELAEIAVSHAEALLFRIDNDKKNTDHEDKS